MTGAMRNRHPSQKRRAAPSAAFRGFSLIELMIALIIAGVLLFGLAVFFVSSSRSFSEAERVSRQIENGRYALGLLSEEIRLAGFYGEVKNVINLPSTPAPSAVIPMPATLPNPCATDFASVKAALPVPLQGVDAPGTAPSCIPDAVSGTDIIVVRRANTTTLAAGSAVANGFYTQTTNCATLAPVFQIAQSGFTLTDKDCTTAMPIRQYHVYIYYIAPCSVATGSGGACAAGDAPLPTLKRVELCSDTSATNSACASGADTMSNPEPLVEGIENIQYEYGLDTNGDGSPDSYTAAPSSVTQWSQVVAVRIHLLARNADATSGYTDTKTYAMGNNADGTANTLTPGGSFRRHAYTALVRVTNVSQRLEPVFP
ncbi:MAG TPA: PilW family protein [Casimicrobiaceae bacterium]|nr:PilW family protein [Casimicrobiaceae bacterium]